MWQRVLEELVASEGVYIAHLNNFVEHLAKILDYSLHPDIYKAFHSIDIVPACSAYGLLAQLRDHHTLFLEQLNALVSNVSLDTLSQVGHLLELFAKVFCIVHTAYAVHYEEAIAALSALRKGTHPIQPILAAFEDEYASLQSILILPIQRIPRYVLLVRELIKHVPSLADTDMNVLVNAKVAMENTATSINLSLSTVGNKLKLVKLQPLLPTVDLHDKVYVRESKFMKATVNSRSAPREYLFYLFTDVVIYCDFASHGPYRVRNVLKVCELNVLKMPEKSTLALVTPMKCMHLTADSIVTATAWVKDLAQAITSSNQQEDDPLHGLLDLPVNLGDFRTAQTAWMMHSKDKVLKLGKVFLFRNGIVLAQTLAIEKHKVMTVLDRVHTHQITTEAECNVIITLDDKTTWTIFECTLGKEIELILNQECPAKDCAEVPPPPAFAPPQCVLQAFPPPIPPHRRKAK